MKTFCLFTFIAFTQITMAQTKMKSTHLSIFKNGSYYCMQEGIGKVANKNFSVVVPDNPLYGTIWMATTKDAKVNYINVKQDTVKTKHEVETLLDMLNANKGRIARLTMNYGGTAPLVEVGGTIVKYYSDRNTVKLKSGDKTSMLTLNNLVKVEIEGEPVERYEMDSFARVARVYVDKTNGELPFSMIYMQNGMNWVPAYALKLTDDKIGRLEMKATIENNTENIVDCDVNLVVGNPQMAYANQIDPIAQGYFPQPVQQQYNYKAMQMNNVAPATADYESTYSGAAQPFNQEITYTTEGEKDNDLYHYRLGSISMNKNSKTIVPISTNTIIYKDVYEVDLYDYTNYFNNRACYQDPNRKFEAYHSLKFVNNTKAPLTSASIFVVNEKNEPLAQDQIKYTPINGEASVRLSKAIDVIIESSEEEKTRTDNYKKINKQNYGLVVIKGEIEVANYQDKAIILKTSKVVNGEVTTQSDNGKTTKLKNNYYGYLNPNTTINWDIDLAPNQKKKITYEYEVLVPM